MCKNIAEKLNKSVLKAIKSIKTSACVLKEAPESREKVSKSCSMADQVEMKKKFITSFASLSNRKRMTNYDFKSI